MAWSYKFRGGVWHMLKSRIQAPLNCRRPRLDARPESHGTHYGADVVEPDLGQTIHERESEQTHEGNE